MILDLTLAFLYLLLTLAVLYHERRTFRRYGGDAFTVIACFVIIYILIPSIVIYGTIALSPEPVRTSVYFFDDVYGRVQSLDSIAVFLLSTTFIGGLLLAGKGGRGIAGSSPTRSIGLNRGNALGTLFIGLVVCGSFFWALGTNFEERYAGLILFRNNSSLIEKNLLTANAFSLTQTFTWISASLFFCYINPTMRARHVLLVPLIIFFAITMGARRAFIFPILIVYLSFVLQNGRFYLGKILLVFPLAILWIAYGKGLTGIFAFNTRMADVLSADKSVFETMLRAFSDIGISQVQSLAVFQRLDQFEYPRFGVDHFFSVMRKIPDGALGLNIDWPERIVRTTTVAFTGDQFQADIPPGLIGQSWLDLPVIGALLWGFLIGFQGRLLNRLARKVHASSEKVAVVVLFATIIAMPINTGSYDFTFSIDIIFLLLFSSLVFRLSKPDREDRRGATRQQ